MANEIKNSIVTGAKQQSSVTSALGRLTKREQTMIYALIIVGAICALAFLVVVPGLERIQTLNNEAAQAEEQRQEYITVIAQGQGTEEIIAEAQVRYDNAKEKLFSQMMPEAIDTTVTKYLVKAGFDPQTLGMSPLTPEEVAQFTPQPLNGDPIPEPPVDQVAPAEDPAAAPAEAESSDAPAEGQPAPEEGQTDPAESPAEPPADQDVQEEASATSLGDSAENRNGANGGAVSNGGKASIGGGMASAHPWDGSIFLTVYADDIVAEGATTDDVA
ncbi:MAG: hypothetical protein LBT52_00740, partial [Clostridiales Family XIII bacterium]|nr:hypothetical protein [Clostridiales Family XIII bacterium]